MNFLNLISQLLPIATAVVPGGSQAALLAKAAANLLAYIQQQSNMTTEQILARAGVQLDDNEVELLKDLARLQGGGTTGGGTGGTTGGTGGSSTGGTTGGGTGGSTPGGGGK
jgi:hypothetical protein